MTEVLALIGVLVLGLIVGIVIGIWVKSRLEVTRRARSFGHVRGYSVLHLFLALIGTHACSWFGWFVYAATVVWGS